MNTLKLKIPTGFNSNFFGETTSSTPLGTLFLPLSPLCYSFTHASCSRLHSKFGNHIFLIGGLEEVTDPKQASSKENWWKTWEPEHDGPDHPASRWMEARTGIPFIDANMAELKETG